VLDGNGHAARVDESEREIVERERLGASVIQLMHEQSLAPVDPRTTVEARGGFDRPPLERTPAVARLYDQARAIAREWGHDLAEGGTGGGSDGNFTAALGIPTLDGLGAVGDGAHALHEHVVVDALCDRAALVAGLIASL